MRRVSAELEIVGGPEEEELIVQGVRFAFRVHQVKKKKLSFFQDMSRMNWELVNFYGVVLFIY